MPRHCPHDSHRSEVTDVLERLEHLLAVSVFMDLEQSLCHVDLRRSEGLACTTLRTWRRPTDSIIERSSIGWFD